LIRASRVRTLRGMEGRVLLVDDEPYILRILSFKMRREGLTPLEARSAAEALHILEEDQVDLILLDVNLETPLDGFDLARLVRSDPATRDLPIIMLTARNFAADARQGRDVGAVGYITKPFSIADVLDRVRIALTP